MTEARTNNVGRRCPFEVGRAGFGNIAVMPAGRPGVAIQLETPHDIQPVDCGGDLLFRRFLGEVFTTIMRYHDMAAQQQHHPHLMTVSYVMMQRTSTPMSYHALPRTAPAPLPAPVPGHMPTQMTTHVANHYWTQAPTYQQQHQAQMTQQLPQGVAPTLQQQRQPQTPHRLLQDCHPWISRGWVESSSPPCHHTVTIPEFRRHVQ